MRIKLFDSREEAIKFYPNYKPKLEKKIRIFDGMEYFKLGSKLTNHTLLWKFGYLFKTVAFSILFVATCSIIPKKLISYTWKKFKQDQVSISIYIKKIFEVNAELAKLESERVVLNYGPRTHRQTKRQRRRDEYAEQLRQEFTNIKAFTDVEIWNQAPERQKFKLECIELIANAIKLRKHCIKLEVYKMLGKNVVFHSKCIDVVYIELREFFRETYQIQLKFGGNDAGTTVTISKIPPSNIEGKV